MKFRHQESTIVTSGDEGHLSEWGHQRRIPYVEPLGMLHSRAGRELPAVARQWRQTKP